VIPASHRIFIRSGDGFAFTAYIERARKLLDEEAGSAARSVRAKSVTGWTGRALAMSAPRRTSGRGGR
jgi:hypothetical protein